MAIGRNPLLDKSNQSQSRVGSGFTNLQRVLSANQNNRLGSTIQSGVRNLAQTNKEQVDQAQQQFKSEAEKNRLDTQENIQFRNDMLQKAASGTGPSDEESKRFQVMEGGEYKGPTALANEDSLRSQAQKVEELGRFGANPDRRKALLQKYVASPNYNLGQQTLDSTILGQNPSVASNIKKEVVGIGRNFDRTSNALKSYATELGGRAKGFGEETQKQLGEQASSYDAQMQAKAAQANQARTALIEKAKQQLQDINKTGTISRDVAEGLGLTEGQRLLTNEANPVWGTTGQGGYDGSRNMADYFQFNNATADKLNVQSAEDAAKIQALQKLGGSVSGATAANLFNQYADTSRIGEFAKTKLASMDTTAYEDDKKRLEDYLNSEQFTQKRGDTTRAVQDIGTKLFGSKGDFTGTNLTREQILAMPISSISNDAVLAAELDPSLRANTQYNIASQQSMSGGYNPALAAKMKEEATKNILEAQKNRTGTVEDYAKQVGGSFNSDLETLIDRYNHLQKLQDWSNRKIKVTD